MSATAFSPFILLLHAPKVLLIAAVAIISFFFVQAACFASA
ncbi:hypothetical protein [Streptomyces clavuligerus]|nr:hypothetical protein [Streptomyces clavuligerus]